MATVRSGCFSLMNNHQRSAGGNLNIGTCKEAAKSEFSSFRTLFPRKRVRYKYKHSGKYWLDKAHRNSTNSLKRVFCSVLNERTYYVKNSTFNSFVDGIRFLTSTSFLEQRKISYVYQFLGATYCFGPISLKNV